ncbi:Soluble lytic murein transglycosylase (EC [Olavius algarvensis Delta 1 endosymbiont]|nr:Soluble lytic murein transglycosylase (EC [Olavius algarvensis Delta 1 endosymbiont]
MNDSATRNSNSSARINQFALAVLIIGCVAIYFKPAARGLYVALKSPPRNSIASAVIEPEIENPLPASIPFDPSEEYRLKIQEAAQLIDELTQKKREIYELIRYYKNGIIDLEKQIIAESREKKLIQYAGAIKHKRVELVLRTIQRRRGYIQMLEVSRRWIQSSSELLLYLKRRTHFDLQLVDIAGGIDLDQHMAQLDLAIHKYRPTAENLPVKLQEASSLPLETIWSRIVKPHEKTALKPTSKANLDILNGLDPHALNYADLKTFRKRISNKLPRYSRFIKAAAHKHGFDWHLIAAQIYQESRFNPRAKSRAGARGMMQILPRTARSLGVKDSYNAVENINAGVRYLKRLYDNYSSIAGSDRMMLALAAYNAGRGHVEDARRLAAQKGLDPNSWDSLKKTLPLLRFRKYYKKSKHGYCRGTEPVNYAKRIMTFYKVLKQQETEFKTAQAKL